MYSLFGEGVAGQGGRERDVFVSEEREGRWSRDCYIK